MPKNPWRLSLMNLLPTDYCNAPCPPSQHPLQQGRTAAEPGAAPKGDRRVPGLRGSRVDLGGAGQAVGWTLVPGPVRPVQRASAAAAEAVSVLGGVWPACFVGAYPVCLASLYRSCLVPDLARAWDSDSARAERS